VLERAEDRAGSRQYLGRCAFRPRCCVRGHCWFLRSNGERALTRDRALRCGVHELRVLGENATRVAGWKGSPAVAASFQLCGFDK
jgi:hypothetical protein